MSLIESGRQWLGNLVDRAGTNPSNPLAGRLPDWGISEYIAGGKPTVNTGSIPLNTTASPWIGTSATHDAYAKVAYHSLQL